MGSAICCGESSNYLPIEERYNQYYNTHHHQTYGNSNPRDDPLLGYSNNKYYSNSKKTMYSCPSCTYQHIYQFEVCEMCGSSRNSTNDITVPLTPEEIEDRRQKTAAAASQRAEKQAGGIYERRLKEKARKLDEYEKRNKEKGGDHQLRWSR